MKNYNSLAEWGRDNPREYDKASRNGWLDEICEANGWDIPIKRKPKGFWDIKENVLSEASKHNTITAWSKSALPSVKSAKINGWFDECTKHMTKKIIRWTKEKVLVDAREHKNKNSWRNNGSRSAIDAAIRNGWYEEATAHMVEVHKPNGYWLIKENVINSAKKYNRIVDWAKGGGNSAIKNAKEFGWFEEATAHMKKRITKPHGYWTKKKCIEEAKKHGAKNEWEASCRASYTFAKRKGWVDECCEYMDYQIQNKYWTKERCVKEGKKYKTKKEWRDESKISYLISKRLGWMEEATEHMGITKKPNGYWTKERVLEDARKYKTQKDWAANSRAARLKAHRMGWINECCEHMKKFTLPMGYWTKERVLEDARKFQTMTEWQKKSPSSFNKAYREGWKEEATEHMTKLKKPSGYWQIKENVINSAKKYKLIKEWKRNESTAYNSAHKNGWHYECKEIIKQNKLRIQK